jgi:hypothetical protein
MRLQIFAAPDSWEIVGSVDIRTDRFARFYANQARVAIARPQGRFTALICADGATYYVMTSDWSEVEHLAGQESGHS